MNLYIFGLKIKLPFWMVNGKNFIWYRKVRSSRNYSNAIWQHYLTIGPKTFYWETK